MFFKLCSDRLSIEAIPKRHLKIDFVKTRRYFEKEYRFLMWTPHFVVLRNVDGNEEITLRKDGRMIIRKAKSEENARLAAKELMTFLRSFSLAERR
jgi:hypothetical protein